MAIQKSLMVNSIKKSIMFLFDAGMGFLQGCLSIRIKDEKIIKVNPSKFYTFFGKKSNHFVTI